MSSSQHPEDDIIDLETPSAARSTLLSEVNALPEVDDRVKPSPSTKTTTKVDSTTVETSTTSTTSTANEATTTHKNNDDNTATSESSQEQQHSAILSRRDFNTTTADLDIVDESDTFGAMVMPMTNDDDNNTSKRANMNTISSIDEFGNSIVTTSTQKQEQEQQEQQEYTSSELNQFDPSFLPTHDPFSNEHNGDINDDGEFDNDEMNFDPDPIRAADAKVRGNKHFAQSQYDDALECYAEALLFCPEENIPERILYHNNKCAAHVMLKQWEDAVFEASCVVQLDNNNVKALTRRAKAYEQTEQYQEAIEDYKLLSTLEPKMRVYKEKEAELTKKNEEKFEKQKTEMVDKLKGWGNSFLGMFGMSTDNFQFNQDPNSGSYSVNFVQNPGEAGQPAAAAAQQPPK